MHPVCRQTAVLLDRAVSSWGTLFYGLSRTTRIRNSSCPCDSYAFHWEVCPSRSSHNWLLINSVTTSVYNMGFLVAHWLRICLQCRSHRRCRFNPWVRKISWRREWLCIPVFLPGEPHGQKIQVGYSPYGCKEPDTTEAT